MYLDKMRMKLFIVTFLSCLLFACGGNQGDDLDQFMNDASKDMNTAVAPLPDVQPYTPLQYNVDGALNDPFKTRKSKSGGSLQPNTNRPREDLESYPLESLIYVGSLSKKNKRYALIKKPDEALEKVRVGNYLGPNFGLITSIGEQVIKITEVVQDDVTGDWVERHVSINLEVQE